MSVSQSVRPAFFCVRAITLYFMNGFPCNLAEYLAYQDDVSRERTTPLTQRKVKVTVGVQIVILYVIQI